MFADLYVGYPLETGFTYRVPPGMELCPGRRVHVDFGGRQTTGFVYRVHDEEPSDFTAKDITGVIDDGDIFDSRLVELARYIASTYVSFPGEVLSLALPSGQRPSARFRVPFERSDSGPVTFNSEQSRVYDDILSSYDSGTLAHLIFGITGSGKTEIYIELARHFISMNRSVIYLVPEISLSSQVFERLYNVFGDELIIYHSHVPATQRLHNWKRFYAGEAKIAVGTRSAVFLQCPDPGLIIIDEEHDGSYKENSSPRYNAKRVAFYRSRKEGALLVMGSATPSLESMYAAESGVTGYHELKTRYGGARLPGVEIVKTSPNRPSDMISPILKLHTKRAVDSGRQAIYLLNRRGFSPIVICNACGHVVECPDCNISMNAHAGNVLLCHYCGLKRPVPARCEKCGSDDIVKLGSGTQRVEETVTKDLGVRVFRLDQDSARAKNAVHDLIEKMKNGEVDVLLGTQMVAKGFDFHNVTLVGVLLADIGINMPDFRSAERIFSLLVQVAGRCGRGEDPGMVVIQTLNQDHPVFRFIRDQDYYGFYRSELSMRKLLGYPPFSRLARLLVRGKDEERVRETVNRLRDIVDERIRESGMDVRILGPSSAPFTKIGGNYRHHLILKAEKLETLRSVAAPVRKLLNPRDVYLEIDMDPYDLL